MLRGRLVLGLMSSVVASLALAGCSGASPASSPDASEPTVDASTPSTTHDAALDAVRATDANRALDASAPTPDAHDARDAGSPDAHVVDAHAADVSADTFVCDPTQPPSTSPCVLDDALGLFVATAANGGSDTLGDGTAASPYATISHALASLGDRSRVYVCDGVYSDTISITSTASVFGGLTCGSGASMGSVGPWAYAQGTKATIQAAAGAYALQVNAGSAVVDVEDLELDAAPGTSASPSSVAVFAVSSTAVTLRRTTLVAAPGFEGAAGSAGAMGSLTSPASPNGITATAHVAGPAVTCTCSTGDVTTGGAGGGPPANEQNGTAGLPVATDPTPAGATGAGGTSAACIAAMYTVQATVGSNAVPAIAAGGAPATTVGALGSSGWTASTGDVGANGTPGQGGGGAGAPSPTITSGGGGCGGCGGLGGGAGGGGGASIALLAYDAPVQLVASTLSASEGGAGGAGGIGGAPSAPGAGGYGRCIGAAGGEGATGGGGAGGAGGVSFGILYAGTAPTSDVATQILPGTAGAGGAGANVGLPGVAAAMQNAALL